MMLSSSGFSHIGHYREANEDRFLIDDSLGIYAVADGLGGLPGGEIASDHVITSLEQFFHTHQASFQATPEQWQTLWQHLNQQLRTHALDQGFAYPIGTTLSLLYFRERKVWWSHLGDTRIYRLRNQQIEQLTRDHTLLEQYRIEQTSPPEDLSEQSLRNSLTRCLGTEEDFDPETGCDTVNPGDRYLICSDGVWSALEEPQIQQILSDGSQTQAIALNLEQQSLQQGGQDNLSGVIVIAT